MDSKAFRMKRGGLDDIDQILDKTTTDVAQSVVMRVWRKQERRRLKVALHIPPWTTASRVMIIMHQKCSFERLGTGSQC